MDKEDFLMHAMKLLQTFIDKDDEGRVTSLLIAQGVQEDEVPFILHTISNMAKRKV